MPWTGRKAHSGLARAPLVLQCSMTDMGREDHERIEPMLGYAALYADPAYARIAARPAGRSRFAWLPHQIAWLNRR